MPDGVLEIPAVVESVAHVLVVRALGVEDVVQRAFASTRSSSGARGGRFGGMDLCNTRILGVQNPGANINTRYAGTKSHTYDV